MEACVFLKKDVSSSKKCKQKIGRSRINKENVIFLPCCILASATLLQLPGLFDLIWFYSLLFFFALLK